MFEMGDKVMKERVKFIDISRALAIIFIVLGHTLVYSKHCSMIFKLLYSFHVVLFFIVSGYTFKIKKEGFKSFIKKKFIRIMIPYFIWAVLFLVLYVIFGGNIRNTLGTSSSFDIKTQITNILYGNGNMSALKQNSSLWFLPALFSMEIIYYFVISFVNKHKKWQILMLIPLVLISYITNYFLKISLPWGINTVLNVGLFFYIGYLIKEYKIFEKDYKISKLYFILPIFIIGIISCFLNKNTVSCIDYKYGNFTLALLSSGCLAIVTIYIAFVIKKNNVLEYIGKNTIGILIFHKIIILVFQTKLGLISNLLKNSNVVIEFILSITIVTISIICSLIANEVTRKILPLAIGEKQYKV